MSTPRPHFGSELGKRGRLKVYLGFAPGVGKTYHLLLEARALKQRGIEVVLGIVEPRERAETAALLVDLEAVPRRTFSYHQVTVFEMDVEAVLARRPRVVIVDDVAHTNVPGSKHNKRYQDVLLLLERGIDVICACDVAQLESLHDVVTRVTGARVRDTISDSFFKHADQVISIDLDVEELRERVRAGKVVPAEQAEAALAGFFQARHLCTLRELMLRETAESLERAVAAQSSSAASKKGWGGKLMVCLSSNPPHARTLLHRGSRLAGRLNTDWYVVHVEAAPPAAHEGDAATQKQLQENIELAKELGAEVVRLRSVEPVQSLLEFARSHGVSDVVIGRGKDSRWRQLLGKSFTPRMVEQATGLDLHIVSFMEAQPDDEVKTDDKGEAARRSS